MKDYKELDVWHKAVTLAIATYKATGAFPEGEKFGLIAQMRRAATSVPANIAEGWGRGTTKEYIQFLLIARGSLMEFETQAVIGGRLNYLTEVQLGALQGQIAEVGKMLNGLIQSLRRTRASRSVSANP
jgi:four helix bundle protein